MQKFESPAKADSLSLTHTESGRARNAAIRVRVQAIGRLDLLPESVVAAIRAAETATAQHDLMTLTIAVGYGGRVEPWEFQPKPLTDPDLTLAPYQPLCAPLP